MTPVVISTLKIEHVTDSQIPGREQAGGHPQDPPVGAAAPTPCMIVSRTKTAIQAASGSHVIPT